MKQIENRIDDKILSLNDYLIIIGIHYKKIILILIFGTLVGIYSTYTTSPVFLSKATVMVQEKPGTSMIMDFGGSRRKDMLNNEMQKIRSRAVGEEVLRQFWNSDRRNNMFIFGTRKYYPKGESVRRIIKELFSFGIYDHQKDIPHSYDEPFTENIANKFVHNLINSVSVKNKKGSNLIEIIFSSVNAGEARLVANMIANVYQNLEKKWGNEDANNTVTFLEELVKLQENKLIEAEEAVKNYKLKNYIFDSGGNSTGLTAELNAVETQLYGLNADISIKKQMINLIKSKLSNDEKNIVNEIKNNINVQVKALRKEISSLEAQFVQNSILHGESHIAVIESGENLKKLKSELDKKVNVLIAGGVRVQDPLEERQLKITELLTLESEIESLILRQNETEKLQAIYNEKLIELPEKQLEFNRLERDVGVLTQNYTFVRGKLEDAKIKLASTSGKVQIIDLARRQGAPISPNHKRDIILAFVISLGLGLIITFLIEILDNSVKRPGDIENYGLPILGMIPAIGGMRSKRKVLFPNRINQSNSNRGSIERKLITRENPRSPISESYRSLRTSLLYAGVDKETKSILVSSAGPGEGKTTTVANMAITYANLGKKTILIDTDLRRPVVHKVFGLNKEPGITNYLAGNVDDFESLIFSTEIKNLHIVTSGIIPPNPSELLGSQKMKNLIEDLEKKWDMILFDSPPLVAVTDATMVSKAIDKIVIVVKVAHTDKRAFEHTIQSLSNVGAPIGGVVLNAVTQKNSYGSYYYYYQYYNYYGSDR